MPQRVFRSLPELAILHFHSHHHPLPDLPGLTHIHEARCSPTHRLPPHIHKTLEIIYIVSGQGQWYVENESYSLGEGDLLLIYPGEIHYGYADTNAPYTTFIAGFDPAALPLNRSHQVPTHPTYEPVSCFGETIFGETIQQETLVWDAPMQTVSQATEQAQVLDEALGEATTYNNALALPRQRVVSAAYEVEPIFRRIMAELDRGVPQQNSEAAHYLKVLMVQSLLVEMLVCIARQRLCLTYTTPSQRAATLAFKGWLQHRLNNPPSLKEMAEQVNLSPAYFNVVFKRETGLTPHEYLTQLRLETAAQRLRVERTTSITRIAADLGFSSPQYFSLVFHKHKGCSPTQWRHAPAIE